MQETPVSEPFIAQQEYFVRYAETDAMGLVHHSSYIIYMEEARSHYSRERGFSYHEMEASGRFILVTDLQVRYAASARYGDKVRVRCWVESMKSRQFTMAYEILNAETDAKLVTATTRHLCVDREGNLLMLPPELRAWGRL
jgi:acyl-CoA thioester hydrolase